MEVFPLLIANSSACITSSLGTHRTTSFFSRERGGTSRRGFTRGGVTIVGKGGSTAGGFKVAFNVLAQLLVVAVYLLQACILFSREITLGLEH